MRVHLNSKRINSLYYSIFKDFQKEKQRHEIVSKIKKPRKARTAFTDQQLNNLEKHFARQKYLSVQDRMELATKLGLSDTQVKTWYQNRR